MNKLLKIIPAIFLALFLISLTTAGTCDAGCSINTYLEFGSTTSNVKTVTQGDTVELVQIAYSYGKSFTSEKLVILPSSFLLIENSQGTEINSGTYIYSDAYTLGTISLSEGEYTIRFIAENGYETEYSDLTLIVEEEEIPDTTDPILDIINPIATTYTSHRTELTFNVYDENLASCTYSLNENSQVSIPGIVNGQKTITQIISNEGKNTWSVTCNDDAGNSVTDSVTFYVTIPTVDDTDPIVEITNPASQTYSSHRTSLVFEVIEENLDYCEYSLNNGVAWTTVSNAVSGDNTVSPITSIEGSNNWKVRCFDDSNNQGLDSVQFNIEINPNNEDPIVEITNPLPGTYASHRTLITFTVDDEDLNSCAYSLNGAAQVELVNTITGINSVTGITSIEGINTWSVTCIDDEGNAATDSVIFTIELPEVDETDPLVEITTPVDGVTYYTNKTSMQFHLIEDDLDYCTYSLNGGSESQVVLEHEGTNTINYITSVMGTNTWAVTCHDKIGNIGSDAVTFTIKDKPDVDETDPIVEITNPTSGTTYSSQRTSIQFDLIEENLDYCTYSLNSGSELSVANEAEGVNTIQSITSAEGTNTWTVTCHDKTGNTGSDSITFTVEESDDDEDPEVEIITPINGETYNESVTESKVKITEDDLDSCWYELNDDSKVYFICSDGFNYIDDLDTEDGRNILKVTAEDDEGNKGSDTVIFYIDCGDDECIPCPNRRDSNNIREVVSSDETPVTQYINRPAYVEEDEQEAEVKVAFGETIFYGMVILILLMMIMAVLMFILEENNKRFK